MTSGSQNDRRNRGLSSKEKFCITQSLPVLQIFVWFSQRGEAESLIFDFCVFNGTIHMRELQDSRVINIKDESDIWYFFGNFLDKTSLLGSFTFYYRRLMIRDFLFTNYYTPFFFPDKIGLLVCCSAIIVSVTLNFCGSVRVFLCTYSACPLSFSHAVLLRNRSFRIGSYITLSVALRQLRWFRLLF